MLRPPHLICSVWKLGNGREIQLTRRDSDTENDSNDEINKSDDDDFLSLGDVEEAEEILESCENDGKNEESE